MIHIKTFGGYTEEACINKINEEIPDDKIINVIPTGPVMRYETGEDEEGYQYSDTYYTYFAKVVYRD